MVRGRACAWEGRGWRARLCLRESTQPVLCRLSLIYSTSIYAAPAVYPLCLPRGRDGEQTVTDLLSGNDQVQPSPCGHYEIHPQGFFKILLFIPGEPAAGAGLASEFKAALVSGMGSCTHAVGSWKTEHCFLSGSFLHGGFLIVIWPSLCFPMLVWDPENL